MGKIRKPCIGTIKPNPYKGGKMVKNDEQKKTNTVLIGITSSLEKAVGKGYVSKNNALKLLKSIRNNPLTCGELHGIL